MALVLVVVVGYERLWLPEWSPVVNLLLLSTNFLFSFTSFLLSLDRVSTLTPSSSFSSTRVATVASMCRGLFVAATVPLETRPLFERVVCFAA